MPRSPSQLVIRQDRNVSLFLSHYTSLSLQLNPKECCSQTSAKVPNKGCYEHSGSAAKGTVLSLICTLLDIFVFINFEIPWQ